MPGFVPPYLLRHLAGQSDPELAHTATATLAVDRALRASRSAPTRTLAPLTPGAPAWTVHTAGHGFDLPGTAVRSAGDPPSGDAAVDEAYAGVEASVAFFREVLGRNSYDGLGARVLATVHYGQDYDNAFWDGAQLVFGDGDGRVFDRFTKPIDVTAHELGHAVTEHTVGLVYQGQPGALNEHLSDVWGSCVKQRTLGQEDPRAADWLIGEGLFLPSVNGRALRSMAEPGTAYDDPVVGRDPQVGHLDDYVETEDDNGGVHLNSGIPNRAFALVATRLGVPTWSDAASIWWTATTSGIGPQTDFAGFAAATLAAAQSVSAEAAAVVSGAWADVGLVLGDAATSAPGAPEPPPPADLVAVRRSGGFAGLTTTGELRLGDDPRSGEVGDLLARIDLVGVRRLAADSTPGRSPDRAADRFVYRFSIRGEEVTVPEAALTPELSRLAVLLLEEA